MYFKFGPGGDQYLGRVLALLDPSDPSFATLPPHWANADHPDVKRGMKLMFGEIQARHASNTHDPSGLLSLLLESLVYHSDWLRTIASQYPGHPFNSLALLHEPDLLASLKDLVTLEKNEDVPIATGVPPHVVHAQAIAKVLEACEGLDLKLDTMTDSFEEAVHSAIDEKMKSEGGVNAAIMTEALATLKDEILAGLQAATISRTIDERHPTAVQTLPPLDPTVYKGNATACVYKGRFWCVPATFCFPSETYRRDGWRKWLKGSIFLDAPTGKQYKIKPYRLLRDRDLHTQKLKNCLKLTWRPLFTSMSRVTGLELPDFPDNITDEDVTRSYNIATDYLKQRFNYLFGEGNEGRMSTWVISTWSRKLQVAEVEKNGTLADKAMLPTKTIRNQAHAKKRTVKKAEVTKVRRSKKK